MPGTVLGPEHVALDGTGTVPALTEQRSSSGTYKVMPSEKLTCVSLKSTVFPGLQN